MIGNDPQLEPVVPERELVSMTDLRIHFTVRGSRAPLRAVDGISFSIRAGEAVGLIGESGSGKSTLGRGLLQLVRPTAGSVVFRGVELTTLSRGVLRRMRRHCQMIFQDPSGALDPRMTVAESIREPLAVQGIGTRIEQEGAVHTALERVSLTRSHGRRYPHELSGGQKQRVNIARALVLRPDVVVCDEPVAALDASLQADILNLFRDLQRERGLSYLFISHNLAAVSHISDRVAVMYLGQLVELGPVDDVVRRPRHPYTEALVSANPVPLPRRHRTDTRIILDGEIPSPTAPPSGCRFRTRCRHAQARCAAAEPAWRPIGSDRWVACHFAEDLGPSPGPQARHAPGGRSEAARDSAQREPRGPASNATS